VWAHYNSKYRFIPTAELGIELWILSSL